MAAWSANIGIIEYLVGKGANINDKQAGGFGSILHAAVFSGDVNTVKYLIKEQDMDINVLNKRGMNILDLSNDLQPKGLLKRIIDDEHIQVEAMDENEKNELKELEYACKQFNMSKYLTDEIGMEPALDMTSNIKMDISKAIENKDTELAKKLIEQNDIDLDFIYTTENYFTCYELALNTELAIYLLENKGLDVNKTFRNHDAFPYNILTLIMMYAKDIELMKYVIEAPNIDTSSIYHYAGTLLTFACMHISLDGVVYLAKNMEENGVNNAWSILQELVERPKYLSLNNEEISKKNALVQYLKEEKGIQADVNISPNEVEDIALLLGDVEFESTEGADNLS